MAASVTIARVWGIPIQLHWSFLLVLPLFAYLMGQFYFGAEDATTVQDYLWGGALAVALFASVIAHELGHSWTARRFDVEIDSIMLLPIGGVSQMERMPEEPGEELRVAVAGPLVSFAIAAPLLAWHLVGVPAVLAELPTFVFFLGYLNGFLGAFNLLVPAFPMDGGRVLRAGLAHRMGLERATEIAAGVGRGLAVVLGLAGFLTLGGGGWLLVLIAFFVYLGASQEERQVRATAALEDLTAADAMTREVRAVHPDDSLEDLVTLMLRTRHVAFPVVEEGRAVGVVDLEDLRSVPTQARVATLVRDVMDGDPPRVAPGEEASELLRRLDREREDHLVLVEDGGLEGVVTRRDLERLVEIRGAGDGARTRRDGDGGRRRVPVLREVER